MTEPIPSDGTPLVTSGARLAGCRCTDDPPRVARSANELPLRESCSAPTPWVLTDRAGGEVSIGIALDSHVGV